MDIFDSIKKHEKNHLLSKNEKIITGILEAIQNKTIVIGDKLPSVVNMSKNLGYANRTTAIAYNELKNRGVIVSKKAKGYYLASTNTDMKLKVALVLFGFRTFQEEFYNTFREQLSDEYQIEVFFHHNNSHLFKTILNNINGKYGFYVVAPIQSEASSEILQIFPPEKTLIIDRLLKMPKEYSFICQEFEYATYQQLGSILNSIRKYKKLILFYSEINDDPRGISKGFETFANNYSFNYEILEKHHDNCLEKGNLYFFISDTPFWKLLRDVNLNNYKLGDDIGIIAHNDTIDKEIIFGGITTFSTNYNLMALKAAQFIADKNPTYDIIPSKLIIRNSL